MCQKCAADWDDRKAAVMQAMEALNREFGQDAGGAWLWNETPFPCDLPSWDQIALAFGRKK